MSAQDPYYANVGLLVPFEGCLNQTGFIDFSSSPHTLVGIGNTKISTATSKWGKGSLYLDGSNDSLRVGHSSKLSLSDNFTLSLWIRADPSPPHSLGAIISQDYGSGNTPMLFSLLNGSGNWNARYYSAVTSEWDVVNGLNLGDALSFNTWYHFETSRSGQTYRGFRNGVLIDTKIATNNPAIKTKEWIIGANRYSNYNFFKGYIQDLCFTQKCRHTADFTPPGRLVVPHFPNYGPSVTIGNNLTISGSGAGDYVAILDAVSKELVTLVEPDIDGDWSASVPMGDYYAVYFGDGCQPIAHGPYTLS